MPEAAPPGHGRNAALVLAFLLLAGAGAVFAFPGAPGLAVANLRGYGPLADDKLAACPRAVLLLGAAPHLAIRGACRGRLPPTGPHRAHWSLPAAGERAQGEVELEADPVAGAWLLRSARLQVGAETVDLLDCREPVVPPPHPPAPPGPDLAELTKRCADGEADACLDEGVARGRDSAEPAALEKAHLALARACQLGIATGEPSMCGLVAEVYRQGAALPVDEARAAVFEGKERLAQPRSDARREAARCRHGERPGCYAWAVLLATGDGVPRDRARAKTVFARACDKGMKKGGVDACQSAAEAIRDGSYGIMEDPDLAERLGSRACEIATQEGEPGRCIKMALHVRPSMSPIGDVIIGLRKQLEGKCKSGDGSACSRVRALAKNAEKKQ